uniref:RabBD domain-containing protein n=1 Tax=Trichobilharzia regenti TaxID=157069 RepID=A0AA85IUQ5_TRIRE|nr:unnamed protein product [Trichobilharzia regenti]
MGNETSQAVEKEDFLEDNTSHRRSQSLQRDFTAYLGQSSPDKDVPLSSVSRKSQSHISLHDKFGNDESSRRILSPKLKADTSTTGIALLKTVQMELTDEEKERIQQVLARARLVERKEDERITKLQCELKRTEQDVKRRVSLSNQDVVKQIYNCTLCERTPPSDGQDEQNQSTSDWRVCHDCENTICPNCVVQIGRKSDTEKFWLCKLCQKKRQLVASSGSWLQGLTKADNKQKKTMHKILQKTQGITRTASYSQYEDLIDQVSLDESSVNSSAPEGQNDEEEDERDKHQKIDGELIDLPAATVQIYESQASTSLKQINNFRRASEQISMKNVTNVSDDDGRSGLFQPRKLNESVNTGESKVSTSWQSNVHSYYDTDHSEQILSREDRLHLYFTKQISEHFDDNEDDGVDSSKPHTWDDLNTINEYDNQKEPLEYISESSVDVQHLQVDECFERIEVLDEVKILTPSVLIEEKSSDYERYPKITPSEVFHGGEISTSTHTVPCDEDEEFTSKYATCRIEEHNLGCGQTENINKNGEFSQDRSTYEYSSTGDNKNYANLDSFQFHPSVYKDYEEENILSNDKLMQQRFYFSQNSKISPVNTEVDDNKWSNDNNPLSVTKSFRTQLSDECIQPEKGSTDYYGLIITQNKSQDIEDNNDFTSRKNNDDDDDDDDDDEYIRTTEMDYGFSQYLETLQMNEKDSNYTYPHFINQSRRQSCPSSIDTKLSFLQSPVSSRQKRYLSSQYSYLEENQYDFNSIDDKSTSNICKDRDCAHHDFEEHYNPVTSSISHFQHHEVVTSNLDLLFPYSLEEPWDYAEDLRKIDEDIYRRTSTPSTTVSCGTMEEKGRLMDSSKSVITQSIGLNESEYVNSVIQSSISDYENIHFPDEQTPSTSHFHTTQASMNDAYLNWLNDMKSSYYYDQQDTFIRRDDYNSLNNNSIGPTTTTSIAEQNVILKRCPNFENISCLSNGPGIQLTHHDSDVMQGKSMISYEMHDEKEDIEVNSDKPTKIWGREYRDRAQTSDSSTCITNIYNDVQPELEIWSNIFNTSEMVVDTAREISTQLNLLSSLEEGEGRGNTEGVRHNIDENFRETAASKSSASSAPTEVATIITTATTTRPENIEPNVLFDTEKKELMEYGKTLLSYPSPCESVAVPRTQHLRSFNTEEDTLHLESLPCVTDNAFFKMTCRNTESIDDNDNSLQETVGVSSQDRRDAFNEHAKFQTVEDRSIYTLLPNDEVMQVNEEREEKFQKTEDLCHLDKFELCEHVTPKHISPLLDNYSAYTINQGNSNSMNEKDILKETLYPDKNQIHTCVDSNQPSLIKFSEEDRNMKITNQEEVRQSSTQLDEISHPTTVGHDSDQCLKYLIDQSNYKNSRSSFYAFDCLNLPRDAFQEESNSIFDGQYITDNWLSQTPKILNDELNSGTSIHLKPDDLSEKSSENLSYIPENKSRETSTTNSEIFNIKPDTFQLSAKQKFTTPLIKPSYCSSEKTLKRAQFILSSSPVYEPDPTDTLLALTDNTTTSSSNNFSFICEKDLSKSSIKNYFLSLSCPQSLSSQLTEENNTNFDALSECSSFSLHVPIAHSKQNETGSNESQLSSLSNFEEYFANRHLWEPFHSHWYIHILKRIKQETLLTSIPEQISDIENIHMEYMSSSSSSRGSYFLPQRRRPHSSTYSYEVNNLGDDLPAAYESPNSSSSAAYSGPSYSHKSLHDVYPDRFIRPSDYPESSRTYNRMSSKSSLKHHYDSRPYRSYSEAGALLQQKDKSSLVSAIRHDRRGKLGFVQTSGRFKHVRSGEVEMALQQRILKDTSRGIKPLSSRNSERPQDSTYTSRFNKAYQDSETSFRLRRPPLRSSTPTYRAAPISQTRWSNDSAYLEAGSYYSLPLHDYHRRGTRHSRPSSITKRHAPLHTDVSVHRRMFSDDWGKADSVSQNIGKFSKSTGQLSQLDDLGKISGCTSMQTLRARLAAAHSEFNLDDEENLSDSFQSQKLKSERFGSLDRHTDSRDFTTRQLRRQVEQHHRRLLKSLMSDEPLEPSWPSSFSTVNIHNYLNVKNAYTDSSDMRPTTLISSTLAPPIFSTAASRLPLNIEQGRIEGVLSEPLHYITTNDQLPAMPNVLTTSNLNSVNPNPLPLINNISENADSTSMQGNSTSASINQPLTVTNDSLMELINNPELLQALSYNPSLVNQINSMCLDLGPSDLNQVTLAAVAGAIAATAVAGSGMLDNNQTVNEQDLNSLLQNLTAVDQMNAFTSSENPVSNGNNYVNNPSNLNSTYLNSLSLPSSTTSGNANILGSKTPVPCEDVTNPDSIDALIKQVRKLLDEQNNINAMETSLGPSMTTSTINMSYDDHVTPSYAYNSGQPTMVQGRTQNFNNIYPNNFQKLPGKIPTDQVYKQQYPYKTPSETIDSWLGLSEDEWNSKSRKDNTKISDSWTDAKNTWPTYSSLPSTKTRSSVPTTKCTYDFPTKRLLLMRESKDRHHKGGGIGMRIVGGHIRSDGNLGAFVEEIYPSGPADQLHGEIKEGDEILEWNSIPLVGKTFEEVQAIISQVSEETELLVRVDCVQGDDEEGEDDGEDIEEDEEEEEDEEYDEEYIDDDEEQQDDEDTQSLVRNCGSGSNRNSGQGSRPHALCHHHAAQHALMNQAKGPICPHMHQHYLSIPSGDRTSTSQITHESHKLQLPSVRDSAVEQGNEVRRLSSGKTQIPWFDSNSPIKAVGRPSPLATQDSKGLKKSIAADGIEMNSIKQSSKGAYLDGPRGSHSSHNDKEEEDPNEYGEIELILTFDDYDQSLTVHVARARNLPSMDLNGLADPFVKVRLHPDPTEDPDFNRQTKYMPNTLTPEWQQTVVFMNCIKRTLKRRVLEVTVWDFDRLKTNDFMGQTIINLGDKEYLDGKPHWFTLHKLMPVVIPTSKKSVSSSKTSSDSSRQAKIKFNHKE